MGTEENLVSPALEVARAVKNLIEENNIARDQNIGYVYREYTRDSVDKFEHLSSAILNQKITCAERADIETY